MSRDPPDQLEWSAFEARNVRDPALVLRKPPFGHVSLHGG